MSAAPMSLALAIFSTALFLGVASAQTPLSFEVSEVRLSAASDGLPVTDLKNGRLTIVNVPLSAILNIAFSAGSSRLVGVPGWAQSIHVDMIAKAAEGTTNDDTLRMLQTLVAERFLLKVHHESKVESAFALTRGNKDLKLSPPADAKAEPACDFTASAQPGVHYNCVNMTMPQLASSLRRLSRADVDGPVVDQTHLSGTYDFVLGWSVEAHTAGEAPAEVRMGLTIFDAVSQLGLKLEAKKLPVDVIVFDSMEKRPIAR